MFAKTDTGIYVIHSPTEKIYVGQSHHLKDRLASYVKNRSKHQVRLHRSIAKHGWDKHSFYVIMPLREDISQLMLDYWEQFFMDFYRVEGHELLNIREAGSRGKISDETKKKMSISANHLRHKSKETLLKIGLSKKGKPLSDEVKFKISQKMKGIKRTKEHQDKLNLTQIGRKSSDATRLKISISKKGQGLGRKLTSEHVKKSSQTRTGQKRSQESIERMRAARLAYLAKQNKNV